MPQITNIAFGYYAQNLPALGQYILQTWGNWLVGSSSSIELGSFEVNSLI